MAEKKATINQPVTKGVAKVPVVMQLEALECGAASLTMVMAYYGKWVPLDKTAITATTMCILTCDQDSAALTLFGV